MVTYTRIHFKNRIKSHKRDPWYKNGQWVIEYRKVDTKTDAEALEGHFIHKYGTTAYYNTAKANWNELSFIDRAFFWTEYKESQPKASAPKAIDDNLLKTTLKTIDDYLVQVNAMQKQLSAFRKTVAANLMKYEMNATRTNKTIISSLVELKLFDTRNPVDVVPINDLFDMYCSFCTDNNIYAMAHSLEDFKTAIGKIDIYHNRIDDGCVVGFVKRESHESEE